MTTLRPGHYWKTPFIWEPGQPMASPTLAFESCAPDWLPEAMAQVMSQSMDLSDQQAVLRLGAQQSATDLLAIDTGYFRFQHGWWRMAVDAAGQRVGFVLPVAFEGERHWRAERPETTIYYMGVLPAFRGRGHAVDLLAEAVRVVEQAQAWRLFCDTGTDNAPMVRAFQRAGFQAKAPWQRPVA